MARSSMFLQSLLVPPHILGLATCIFCVEIYRLTRWFALAAQSVGFSDLVPIPISSKRVERRRATTQTLK
jgi:hypothetical protein